MSAVLEVEMIGRGWEGSPEWLLLYFPVFLCEGFPYFWFQKTPKGGAFATQKPPNPADVLF